MLPHEINQIKQMDWNQVKWMILCWNIQSVLDAFANGCIELNGKKQEWLQIFQRNDWYDILMMCINKWFYAFRSDIQPLVNTVVKTKKER